MVLEDLHPGGEPDRVRHVRLLHLAGPPDFQLSAAGRGSGRAVGIVHTIDVGFLGIAHVRGIVVARVTVTAGVLLQVLRYLVRIAVEVHVVRGAAVDVTVILREAGAVGHAYGTGFARAATVRVGMVLCVRDVDRLSRVSVQEREVGSQRGGMLAGGDDPVFVDQDLLRGSGFVPDTHLVNRGPGVVSASHLATDDQGATPTLRRPVAGIESRRAHGCAIEEERALRTIEREGGMVPGSRAEPSDAHAQTIGVAVVAGVHPGGQVHRGRDLERHLPVVPVGVGLIDHVLVSPRVLRLNPELDRETLSQIRHAGVYIVIDTVELERHRGRVRANLLADRPADRPGVELWSVTGDGAHRLKPDVVGAGQLQEAVPGRVRGLEHVVDYLGMTRRFLEIHDLRMQRTRNRDGRAPRVFLVGVGRGAVSPYVDLGIFGPVAGVPVQLERP